VSDTQWQCSVVSVKVIHYQTSYLSGTGTDLSVLWVAYATHNTLRSVPTLPW
jgi:hypothetical protein